MSAVKRNLHRELVEAEQSLANVKAQLAYEQANRRRFEAEYRAEAKEFLEEEMAQMLKRIRSTIGSFSEEGADALDSALACIRRHEALEES